MEKYFIYFDEESETPLGSIFKVDCENDIFIEAVLDDRDLEIDKTIIEEFLNGKRGKPSDYFNLETNESKDDPVEVAFDSFEEAIEAFYIAID